MADRRGHRANHSTERSFFTLKGTPPLGVEVPFGVAALPFVSGCTSATLGGLTRALEGEGPLGLLLTAGWLFPPPLDMVVVVGPLLVATVVAVAGGE